MQFMTYKDGSRKRSYITKNIYIAKEPTFASFKNV